MAETAAPAAAALDLDGPPVVHRIDKGHHRPRDRRRQGGDDALSHRHRGFRMAGRYPGQPAVLVVTHLVKTRHVQPRYAGKPAQQLVARGARPFGFADRPAYLEYHLFALADDESIEEIGHGLGVVGRSAAGDDQGMASVPLGGPHRQACQVEHVQQVGKELLVGQAKADDVKVGQRPPALQAEQPQAGGPHGRLHVHPGGKDPLGQHPLGAVEPVVEDGQPMVGHAQIIDVGKGQRPADVVGVPVLDDAIPFAARVAGRLAHLRQDLFQRLFHGLNSTCPVRFRTLYHNWVVHKNGESYVAFLAE